MTLSNSRTKLKLLPKIKFETHTLKQCENVKYLGIYLDRHLNLKQHLIKTKQKMYPLIQNFARNRQYLSDKLAAIWYKSLLRPILEYGAPLLFSSLHFLLE